MIFLKIILFRIKFILTPWQEEYDRKLDVPATIKYKIVDGNFYYKVGEFMNYKRLGDFLTLAIPCATLCMIVGYFSKTEMYKFIIAYLLVSFLTFIMKAMFLAPRPNANKGDSVRLKWSVNDGDTFPSGHTSSAMAGAIYALFIYYPIGVPLVALAILCAWTRVKVKAHFYRDVFFGSIVAQLGCGLVYWDFFKLERWL